MSKLVQALEEAGFGDRLTSEKQLARVVGGAGRRYRLASRALKDRSLVRITGRSVYARRKTAVTTAPVYRRPGAPTRELHLIGIGAVPSFLDSGSSICDRERDAEAEGV